MQLIYLVYIFQDNYNIVRDRFETDSVNVMKNRPLVPKKQRKLQKYTNLAQPREKPWKLSIGTTTFKSFVSHTGLTQTLAQLHDLEK